MSCRFLLFVSWVTILLSLSCENSPPSSHEQGIDLSQDLKQNTVTISGISFYSEESYEHEIPSTTHKKIPIRLVNSFDRSSNEYYDSKLFWAYIPIDSLSLTNKGKTQASKTTQENSPSRAQSTRYENDTKTDTIRQDINTTKSLKKDDVYEKMNTRNEPLKEDEISPASQVEKTQQTQSPRSIENFDSVEKIISQDIIMTAQDSGAQKVIRIDTDEELSDAYIAQDSFRQKSASELSNNTGTPKNFIRRSRTQSTDYKLDNLQKFITRSRSDNNIQTTILGHIAETWSPELQRLENANILKDPDWTFSRNMEWLNEAIKRKDHFRVVSQPRAYDATKDERPPVLHEEIKVLMEEGYLFYQGWMIPVGSYHKSDTGDFILSSSGERYEISDFNRINGVCVHVSCYNN